MKTLKITIVLLLIITNIFAQEDKYQAAMKQGLQMLASGKAASDYLSAANQFERIAKVEKSRWLPVYYASYCNLVAALTSENEDVKDQYLDKALAQANHTETLSVNNSEVYTLKGYIQYMKLSISPMTRLSFMSSSKASLERAIELNPNNPRTYFVQGQNIFYTPVVFGGGKSSAKPLLEKAVAKFRDFKPENELMPNWGAERSKALLAQCN